MSPLSDEEIKAVKSVIELGRRWGYGNLIAHLTTAWARVLIAEGHDEYMALTWGSGSGRGYSVKKQKWLLNETDA